MTNSQSILVYFLFFVLLFIPVGVSINSAAQQGGDFQVSVAGTAIGSIPHQLNLKVTEIPGGQLSEVSGFVINPENVVQVKQGENIMVSTSANLKTHQVKVTNTQGQSTNLLPLPNNAWSLQGLIPGVYTLDIIAPLVF